MTAITPQCRRCLRRPPAAGRRMCERCIKQGRARMRLVNSTRRALGLCVQCRKPTPCWRCSDCYYVQTARKRERRQAARRAAAKGGAA